MSAEEVTTLAFCWRVERSDGAGVALTSHDQQLLRDGTSYASSPGILPAAITRSLGLQSTSAEVSGALTSAAITASDLSLGRWDGARVQLTVVDWSDAESNELALLAGELGGITIEGDNYSVELHGAATRLERPVCPATSEQCRAQFGDKQCRVDLAGRSSTARVTQAEGDCLTLDRALDERVVLGRLRYLTGANTGVATVVIAVEGTQIRVRDLPRVTIQLGSVVEIREGCDKSFATCAQRFSNAENFRGEPHLPGADQLTRYPGV